MSLLPIFKWADATAVGQMVRGNTWTFPLVETIHILALTVLLGFILMIDLRLLGVIKRLGVSQMQRQLHGYINWSLAVILITGVMLWLSEAMKTYTNAAFRPKIILLALAIAYHYTIHRKAASSDSPSGPAWSPAWSKVAAIVSLALWFGVGIAGRAIGFT
jgi:hypothetical protein